METWIDRAPVDSRLGQRLSVWKRMRAHEWDVTVLVAPDSKTVVCLACRPREDRQLTL